MSAAPVGVLEQHQARREGGVATLSVMNSPEPFLSWARSVARVTLICVNADPHARVVSHAIGAAPNANIYERQLIARRYQALDPRWGRVARSLLHLVPDLPDPDELAAMVRWLDSPPAVLVDWTRRDVPDDDVRALTRACLETPRLPLAVAARSEQLDRWLRFAPSSTHALVCEGLVQEEPGEPSTVARSRAELLLYRALDEAQETHGAFELNARLPWLFGEREVEIDLYAPRWQLAIELDGFHHFREPVDFRRDRRKDFEYQMHGIVVVRVLAEDVEDDLPNTVSRIIGLIDRLEERPT